MRRLRRLGPNSHERAEHALRCSCCLIRTVREATFRTTSAGRRTSSSRVTSRTRRLGIGNNVANRSSNDDGGKWVGVVSVYKVRSYARTDLASQASGSSSRTTPVSLARMHARWMTSIADIIPPAAQAHLKDSIFAARPDFPSVRDLWNSASCVGECKTMSVSESAALWVASTNLVQVSRIFGQSSCPLLFRPSRDPRVSSDSRRRVFVTVVTTIVVLTLLRSAWERSSFCEPLRRVFARFR